MNTSEVTSNMKHESGQTSALAIIESLQHIEITSH